MITRKQLIKKYIEFFKNKNHKEIPNASLIPENDPTVLFTTAGMHPIVPYLLGQSHPQGKRLVNVQKCIRTQDIDEVGDKSHLTFFEMLGNWSLNDYFKKQAIEMSFEFLTKTLNISLNKLAISCFAGNKNALKDKEAEKVWKSLGISEKRIEFLKDNWWETAGTGPCGPDTEMFFWIGEEKAPEKFNESNTKWLEIWNDVLMQYEKDKQGNYKQAKLKNIDTGMGLERMLMILNNKKSVYETKVFEPIIKEIEHLSKKKYKDNQKTMRIIADHIKASVFIIADGIIPSNTEQGYVLRKLIRRAIINLRKLNFTGTDLINPIAEKIFEIYPDYNHLQKNKKLIYKEIDKEENKFNETLKKGINIFEKLSKNKKQISGKDSFLLYQSYGFPIEITKDLAKEKNIEINEKDFQKELQAHQKLSQTASSGKFKSGLADNSEETTKLHTAAHLLLQAIKVVLKNKNIIQKGSNITAERLRLDFNFNRKLTEKEVSEIENLVNAQIQSSCEILREEMSPEQAKAQGAEGIFDKKYGEIISVYSIGKFSKEICAGPHIKNTCELGTFKIKKQESSSAGVRRIKAILK